jgi:DNA-binding XRE family transcriptional regulator
MICKVYLLILQTVYENLLIVYNILGVKNMDIKQYEKYKKLGLNIAYYRKDKGFTQLKLAEALDIDRAHMQRIESANIGASLDVIFRLSDALGVPAHKLFEFRD